MDELMTADTFNKVRSLYVVVAFRGESPRFWDWLLWPETRWGDRMPKQVPNKSMEWRRPTYEEAVERQQRFETQDNWTSLVDDYMTLKRRQRLARPA